MFKIIPRQPTTTMVVVARYGNKVIERRMCECPACGKVLNAGPNYTPNYCSECGQRINFNKIKWEEDVERIEEKDKPKPLWLDLEPFERGELFE